MTFFAHEEPKHPSKPCRFIPSALKDAFTQCHTSRGTLSASSSREEYPVSDTDDEQEVVVLAIRNRAMEAKLKRNGRLTRENEHHWVLSPRIEELFMITPKGVQQVEDDEFEDEKDEEKEAFFSVGSYLSRCSSNMSREAFFSVDSCLSRCSSANGIDFLDARRRSIIQELCHCEGWPFGLCRKAMLLPPLPRSPSESWTWRRGTRIVKIP